MPVFTARSERESCEPTFACHEQEAIQARTASTEARARTANGTERSAPTLGLCRVWRKHGSTDRRMDRLAKPSALNADLALAQLICQSTLAALDSSERTLVDNSTGNGE